MSHRGNAPCAVGRSIKGIRCDRPLWGHTIWKNKNVGLCNAHYLRVHRYDELRPNDPLDGKRRIISKSLSKQDRRQLKRAPHIIPPRNRRERLREALVGHTRWENTPLPDPDDPDYRSMPHCGNFGCDCPPLSEVDDIIDRLLAHV